MSYSIYRPFRGLAATATLAAAACTVAFAQTSTTPDQPATQAAAQTQGTSIPDAQVEANVLKALAGSPDIANQPITTDTVYGVVTLTGSVQTEDLRTQTENIVARVAGVKKVVDELNLGSQPASAAAGQPTGSQLPSSETAQNQAPPAGPDSDNTAQPAPNQQPYPAPQARPPYPQQPQYPQSQPYPQQQGQYPQYPQQAPGQYPQYPQQYPQQGAAPYPQQYPQGQPYPPRPYYGQPPQPGYAQQPPSNYGGQEAGQMVTVPNGALIRIRINQTLDSANTKPGTTFDGVVINDVVADGAIAIPRGATIQGTVVDAKKSGALAGRGELSLQLTQIILGGQSYPISSDVWAHNGADKTIQTVNSTAIGGGVGAAIGAIAGGGAGAAIGAGVGGALGLGSSAASHTGQVYIPAEGLLTFHLAQPLTVATLSQAEMDRISQGIPQAAGAPPVMRRRVYAPYPYYPYPYYPYRY